MYKLVSVLWGMLIWLAATLLFQLAGPWFFRPSEPLWVAALFAAAVPIVALVTLPFYAYLQLNRFARSQAAVLIALPGMLLDVYSLAAYEDMFPRLDPDAGGMFGAWLLWAYSLIIASGWWPVSRSRSRGLFGPER